MNLAKLFKMQKELDARILAEHPPKEDEDRLAKKILALQVELEYVDCLHFILSIGLEMGVCPDELYVEPIFCANVTEQFIDLFYETSILRYEERNGRLYEDYLRYDIVLEHFVGLGELLGFTWKQVEEAYIKKNKVNHQRQESGY